MSEYRVQICETENMDTRHWTHVYVEAETAEAAGGQALFEARIMFPSVRLSVGKIEKTSLEAPIL